jgi:hypothetical protein
MSEPNVQVVTEDPAPTKRFNLLRAVKITALALTGVGLIVLLKKKLNSSVDGNVNVTVETADPS